MHTESKLISRTIKGGALGEGEEKKGGGEGGEGRRRRRGRRREEEEEEEEGGGSGGRKGEKGEVQAYLQNFTVLRHNILL